MSKWGYPHPGPSMIISKEEIGMVVDMMEEAIDGGVKELNL